MDVKRRRSPRAALVDCAPSLARIHERIASALLPGIELSKESLGKPGPGVLPVPRFLGGRGLELWYVGCEPKRFGVTENDVVGQEWLNYIRDEALSYFFTEWLSKLDDRSSINRRAREEATWQRFREAEDQCRKANERLRRWEKSQWSRVIQHASTLACRVLGPMDLDLAASSFEWGPGATTRLTRRKSDAAHKYSGSPHSTIGNAILANAAIRHVPLWERQLTWLADDEGVGYVKIVPGNRIVTVPKNYKTDRTIAIEPDMNIYVQKGLGRLMRKRLRSYGVNLNDQTRNQEQALTGSLYEDLATIDLSMASDTVSRRLVELLLDQSPWLPILGQSRSPYGVLPSGFPERKLFYQKFSSMGNGYTFELETLIFWCLAQAVASDYGVEARQITVYGDDIVVPKAIAVPFMELLSYLGFTPNEKKSFWEGPFRESCGKHYLAGYDVTPFYVKQAPRTLLDLFKIHNQIWRFISRADWLHSVQVEGLLSVCRWLRGFAPSKWRKPSIIDGIGDGGFVGHFDEVTPQRSSDKFGPNGWDGFLFRSFVSIPRYAEDFESPGLLVKSVARLEKRRRGLQVILDDPDSLSLDDFEVFPTVGMRAVPATIFVRSSLVRRLATGPFGI